MTDAPFFEDVKAAIRQRDEAANPKGAVCADCGKVWHRRPNAKGFSPAQTQTQVVRKDRFKPDSVGNSKLICRNHIPVWDVW